MNFYSVVGSATKMELWDTVSNEVLEISNPPGFEDSILTYPNIMTYGNDSILLVNALTSIPILQYKISIGWIEIVNPTPSAITNAIFNGLYLLDNKYLKGFAYLNQCKY